MKGLATVAALLCSTVGAQTYSQAFAKQSLYWAAAAYCDSSAVSSWSCQACQAAGGVSAVTTMVDTNLGNFGFVAQLQDGSVVVSFRGTEPDELPDWIDDLDAIMTSYPGCSGCNVHRGFYNSYLGLSQQMMSALDSYNAQSAPAVYVTGHSLGAAMSVLATFDLLLAGYPVQKVTNFGDPRVGDLNFVSALGSLTTAGAAKLQRVYGQQDVQHLVDTVTQASRTAKVSPLQVRAAANPSRLTALAEAVAERHADSSLRGQKVAIVPGGLFRVVHYADIVPHLPPRSILGVATGFVHTVQEIWYSESSASFRVCSASTGEDPNCSDSLSLPDSVSDHLTYLGQPISNMC